MVGCLAFLILGAIAVLASIIAAPLIAIMELFKHITDFYTQNAAVINTLLLLLVIGIIALFWWGAAYKQEKEAKYVELNKEGNEERRERFWETINLPDDTRPPFIEEIGTAKGTYIDWLWRPKNKKVLEEYTDWCVKTRKETNKRPSRIKFKNK